MPLWHLPCTVTGLIVWQRRYSSGENAMLKSSDFCVSGKDNPTSLLPCSAVQLDVCHTPAVAYQDRSRSHRRTAPASEYSRSLKRLWPWLLLSRARRKQNTLAYSLPLKEDNAGFVFAWKGDLKGRRRGIADGITMVTEFFGLLPDTRDFSYIAIFTHWIAVLVSEKISRAAHTSSSSTRNLSDVSGIRRGNPERLKKCPGSGHLLSASFAVMQC